MLLPWVKRVIPQFNALILRSKRIGPVIETIVSAAGLIIAEIGLINPASLKAAETGARRRSIEREGGGYASYSPFPADFGAGAD